MRWCPRCGLGARGTHTRLSLCLVALVESRLGPEHSYGRHDWRAWSARSRQNEVTSELYQEDDSDRVDKP